MMRGFPIALQHDDDGSVLATCPPMPEVTTFGVNVGAALLHSIGAVEEAIAARIADWQDVPAPRQPTKADKGFAPLPMQTLLKVELYRYIKANAITRADLQRRLGVHREQVDRLFRLDHASRLDQIEAAIKAAGAELDVRVRSLKAS